MKEANKNYYEILLWLFLVNNLETICMDLLDSSKRKFSVNASSGNPALNNIQIGTTGWLASSADTAVEYLQV